MGLLSQCCLGALTDSRGRSTREATRQAYQLFALAPAGRCFCAGPECQQEPNAEKPSHPLLQCAASQACKQSRAAAGSCGAHTHSLPVATVPGGGGGGGGQGAGCRPQSAGTAAPAALQSCRAVCHRWSGRHTWGRQPWGNSSTPLEDQSSMPVPQVLWLCCRADCSTCSQPGQPHAQLMRCQSVRLPGRAGSADCREHSGATVGS